MSTCFFLQELIATADADGIVRTYRPLFPGAAANGSGGVGHVGSVGAVNGLPSWQFELIVECRLGSAPAACEFAIEKENALAYEEGEKNKIHAGRGVNCEGFF